jgi:quinol monooxygenase YgiN
MSETGPVIVVIARFRPRDGKRDELLELLREVQAASRRDDGCLAYGYYSEVADADSFIAVEHWRDRAALDAHLRTPHVARLIEALPRLGDGAPDIEVNEIASTGPMRIRS